MSLLPIISLADLADDPTRALKQLACACRESGFFYLIDHGLPAALIEAHIRSAHAFFGLPSAVKTAYGHAHQPGFPVTARGYVGERGEILHPAEGPDLKQHFDWGIDRPGQSPFSGPSLLPDDAIAPGFTVSALALQDEVMGRLLPPLRHAIVQALGLPATLLDPYFGKPTLIQRCSYYPAAGGTAGRHTDNGFITVLIQQPLPHPSLSIFTRGQWQPVPCVDGAVVINLGDMLARWSGAQLVSTPHRVQHCQAQARVSLAFFIYPDIDAVITPLDAGPAFSTRAVMLNNFDAIWRRREGAGRALELA
jgi:isopenicillin N synthase-like dioxygenase